ncbi:MAG TPA: hypothetical protein VER96_31190 [Polyangiaceae bacterium]|nr:hypothetical protein [Polyangiaceae bacterium]
MGRLIKLSRRIVASGAILAGASVLAQAFFTTAPAKAANKLCTDLPGYFIVSGSSAVQPTIAALGQKLAAGGTSTLVYSKQGSCTGVAAILGTPPTTAGTALYWDTTTTAKNAATCDMPASTPVDVGVSDVFATSCPTVKGSDLSKASVGDFHNFFAQVMEFIVPAASDQVAISAEAAYLTFGFGNSGATPWNNQNLFLIRNNTSGTQIMLSKAIGLDVSKWIGFDEGGAGTVLADIKAAQVPDPADTTKRVSGDAKKMIGIVSSGEADGEPVAVKRLAFQAAGQTCAYWADSGAAEFDKKYVRDGHYPVWGPLHVLAKVDEAGNPTSEGAKKVLDFLGASDVEDTSTLDLEISAHVVPLCAMNVTRSSELGALSSFQPSGACGCYFDSKMNAGGAAVECMGALKNADRTKAACDKSTEATVCTGDRKVCNYGFCEVK